MNLLDAIFRLVEILAWPVTVVVVAVTFHAPFTKLILKVARVRYRDVEVEFDRETLVPADGSGDQLKTCSPPREEAENPEKARKTKMAGLEFESAAIEFLRSESSPFRPSRVMQNLRIRDVNSSFEADAVIEHGEIIYVIEVKILYSRSQVHNLIRKLTLTCVAYGDYVYEKGEGRFIKPVLIVPSDAKLPTEIESITVLRFDVERNLITNLDEARPSLENVISAYRTM